MNRPRLRIALRRLMIAGAAVAAPLGAWAIGKTADEPIPQFRDKILAAKYLERSPMPREVARIGDLPVEVSLVRLIANPDLYHDKPVRVEGFLNVEFEGTALYLSRDDSNYLINRNGLWISFGRDLDSWKTQGLSPEKFKRRFVLIEGVFDKGFLGHMGAFSGGIREIWRVMELTKYYDK